MKFVLSFRLEHFDEIHQIFVFQVLEDAALVYTRNTSRSHFQHANFSHGDPSNGGIIVGLNELLDCHDFSIILIATFEHLT
jgi:hypothetical protein